MKALHHTSSSSKETRKILLGGRGGRSKIKIALQRPERSRYVPEIDPLIKLEDFGTN